MSQASDRIVVTAPPSVYLGMGCLLCVRERWSAAPSVGVCVRVSIYVAMSFLFDKRRNAVRKSVGIPRMCRY